MKVIRKDILFVQDIKIRRYARKDGYARSAFNLPKSIPNGTYDVILIPKHVLFEVAE